MKALLLNFEATDLLKIVLATEQQSVLVCGFIRNSREAINNIVNLKFWLYAL